MGPRRVLVTDLDGTLVGDDGALERFRGWRAGPGGGYRLVYASGRRGPSVEALVAAAALPAPDAIVSGVGTEVLDAAGRPWPGWPGRLDGWDAERIRTALRPFRWLVAQPAATQSPLKVSYDARGLTDSDRAVIRRALADAGLAATLVYSGGLHLDLLPEGTGKGHAAAFLARAWGVAPGDVLAFGDSGNDAELLTAGFRGTLVANALPELREAVGDDVYRSPLPFADGILDGVRHWSERCGWGRRP